MEFRPWKDPDELVAKLIGRTRRFGRCRNEDFWWYRRIVGRGEVGSKLIRRDVGCCLSGSGRLLLASSGGGS